MDDILDTVLQDTGLDLADFRARQEQPSFRATADPVAIQEAVSQPNTVYATIEEDHSEERDFSPIMENNNLSNEDFDEILSNVGFGDIQSPIVELTEAEELVAAGENILEESVTVASAETGEDNNFEYVPSVEGVTSMPDESTIENSETPSSEQQEEEMGPEIKYLTIPENSKTFLMDETTSRFSGAEWYKAIQETSIILAGIGGIGSNLAYQLARMHPKTLMLYDDDMVELGNMSGQLFSKEDVGVPKVNAMFNMISHYTTADSVFAVADKFEATTTASDIMICGFDNMMARKVFFNAWKSHVLARPEEERYKCLYLDGRLSIDTLQVFCITGNDFPYMRQYEEDWLFDDKDADETVCSLKQTTYMACMIASLMTNLFTNFVANTLHPVLPYDLPFFTEYDAQNMIFTTKA